jgi:hypothetical protein
MRKDLEDADADVHVAMRWSSAPSSGRYLAKEAEMKRYSSSLKVCALIALIVGFSLCLNATIVFSQEQVVAEGTTISAAQLLAVQQVQRNNEAQLFSVPGIVGVGIGLTERGDELGLHVYLDVNALGASYAAIPQQVDAVPVQIMESDELRALDAGPAHRLQYNLPVPMGVSTSSDNTSSDNGCFSGTLGARVFRKGNSSRVGYITNNHVAAAGGANLCPNSAAFSENQFQRSRGDNDCSLTGLKKIGDLIQFIPIVFGDAFENTVDAAFVLSSRSLVKKTIRDIGSPSASILEPALNMPVQKSGRTTGRTFGTITTINATVNIGYGACGSAKFVNQMIITPGTFSTAGDSGSLILHRTLQDSSNRFRPVGLLFAGSSTITVGNRISDVLGALSAVIDTF